MRIIVEQIPFNEPEEIRIRCHDPKEQWVAQANDLLAPPDTLIGWKDDTACKLKLRDVYYFEVVDGRSFFYTEKDVYESRMKLYEFEELSQDAGFFRASRSMMVSADRVREVRPSLSGRFQAMLSNGEIVIVSRQYVGSLKRVMGL